MRLPRPLPPLVLATLLGCTTITEEMPGTTITAGSTVPIVVVQLPLTTGPGPSGTATPISTAAPGAAPQQPGAGGGGGGSSTPTPAPAPTSAPGPAPAPAPAPSSSGCSLGPGSGDGNDCPRTSPAFLADVDAAIERVIQQRPELFNGNRVRDWNAYFDAVVGQLRAVGFCAIFDGEEIAIKNTNNFSEQYHVLLSSGTVRRGENTYRATCRPAWF